LFCDNATRLYYALGKISKLLKIPVKIDGHEFRQGDLCFSLASVESSMDKIDEK
jgi:hypothetical protein